MHKTKESDYQLQGQSNYLEPQDRTLVWLKHNALVVVTRK